MEVNRLTITARLVFALVFFSCEAVSQDWKKLGFGEMISGFRDFRI